MSPRSIAVLVLVLLCTPLAAADVIPPGWVDHAGATSASTYGNNQDTVSLAFSFPFYGASSSQVKLQSNGYLGLASALTNTDSPTAWPDGGWGTEIVAAMWHDFNPAGTTPHIYYETVGSAGDRRFVATWDTYTDSAETQANVFQIQLHEATGDISYHYYALDAVDEGSRVGINAGDGVEYTGFWYDGAGNYDGGGSYNANQDGPDGSLEGWRITYSYDSETGSYQSETTYVPEPGTMALMLIGVAGGIAARRRSS